MSDQPVNEIPDQKPRGMTWWALVLRSTFVSAAILLCIGAIQRNSGEILAGAALALFGLVRLIANPSSLRK
jgi:hypothetical protein